MDGYVHYVLLDVNAAVYYQDLLDKNNIVASRWNMVPVIRTLQGTSCPLGDVRGTVVERWAAGQQVERSILHQGHDS